MRCRLILKISSRNEPGSLNTLTMKRALSDHCIQLELNKRSLARQYSVKIVKVISHGWILLAGLFSSIDFQFVPTELSRRFDLDEVVHIVAGQVLCHPATIREEHLKLDRDLPAKSKVSNRLHLTEVATAGVDHPRLHPS